MEVGKSFESFDELDSFMSNCAKEQCSQFWICDSRTIEGARKRGYKKHVEQSLKYTELRYKCIHSSAQRSSRSKGKRPNQRTFRQDCPFVVNFKVSDDGNKLMIKKLINEHNHECSKEAFSFLPTQRKMDAPTELLAKHMLSLRANKKLLQAEILQTQNQKVTLKDLHNLAAKNSPEGSLEEAVTYLKKGDGNIVELVKTKESNELLGIFYQDYEMRRIFDKYPEIIFIDVIHKVSDRNMPLYIIIIEDANGDSEIVSFFLVSNEEETTICRMAEIFKSHNAGWMKTCCIMADKDFVERKVFARSFPDAKMLICLSHCLRTMRKEITTEKMSISSRQRDECLKIIQSMAYARNETEYFSEYEKLKETDLFQVIDYFNRNWHDIRSEWVISLQQQCAITYGNRTNNRLEAINSKVMQVVKRKSALLDIFCDLDTLLVSLRTECDYRAAEVKLKVPYSKTVSCQAELDYMMYLTPFAYSFVATNLSSKDRVEILDKSKGLLHQVKSSYAKLDVTIISCTCPFFTSMQLPCKHVFKVRDIYSCDLFCKGLVAQRWTKDYYLNNCRIASNQNAELLQHSAGSTCSIVSTPTSPRVLTQHQKFKIAANKAQKLATVISEASGEMFQQRIELLDKLIEHFANDEPVTIALLEKDDTHTII